MPDQPYYVVHQEGDAVIAYKLFDPRDPSVRVVVVRAVRDALGQTFDDAYEAAHTSRRRKRPVDFEMPSFAFGSVEALAAGVPDLGERLHAVGVSQLIEHLRDAEKIHGRLHENYSGWFEPKPFEKNGLEMALWRRMHERLVPDMSRVTSPTYDAEAKTLTFFTILNDPPEPSRYGARYVKRHIARRHTVDMAARPWVFEPAEQVSLLKRHLAERERVDEAFDGHVEVYLPTYLSGVGTMLVNLTPPDASDAKRFVILDADEVLGRYDSIEGLMRAYPELEEAALVQNFLSAIRLAVRPNGIVIEDPEAWASAFGREERVRIGAPMFTLNEDLSDYEVIPARAAPEYAGLVKAPSVEGALITVYVQGADERGFEDVLDTRTLTENTRFARTELAGSRARDVPRHPGLPSFIEEPEFAERLEAIPPADIRAVPTDD